MKRLGCLVILLLAWQGLGQPIGESPEIIRTATDQTGRIQIEVKSTESFYYVLSRRLALEGTLSRPVSITLGRPDSTTLTEQLGSNGPLGFYQITQYRIDTPADTDKDGIDDIEELMNPGRLSPLSPGKEIPARDGVLSIPDRDTFKALSYQGLDVLIDTQLEGLEYVKFQIEKADTSNPEIWFINTITHRSHPSFMRAIGLSTRGGFGGNNSGTMRGVLVFRPLLLSPNGKAGMYTFEFEPNDAYSFERIDLAAELLAANAQVFENNLAYYPLNAAISRVERERALYDNSRVRVMFESDLFENIAFLPLNVSEAYGRLRLMELDERPSARDIVLYRTLPNEMPRVSGIITEVPQTPLSHVNLRAIQDDSPNAFIAGATDDSLIASLIGKDVYYQVEADGYKIREATQIEINTYFEALRPKEPQIPERNLATKEIIPLDDIGFESSDSFGVKTSNLATMRTFGFPDGTIPDGFGIPFYFYDEFMKHNDFYSHVEALLATPEFQTNIDLQETMLVEFRKTIRSAEMPDWMLGALSDLQNTFPEGISIRCRSSTNNEDLPGFSGAGLYTSKTQHPDEGHISKSIKQVYASLWNFRAFEAREFYRIDHFAAAMGVLIHPNFSDEQANGVGVSRDPIYQTEGNFYLNTQVGEDLVTNPEALSIPEEILLASIGRSYTIVSPSNLIADGTQILSDNQITELRTYLGRIHRNFGALYDARRNNEFAMEIEYKITKEGKIAIKQARPWVN